MSSSSANRALRRASGSDFALALTFIPAHDRGRQIVLRNVARVREMHARIRVHHERLRRGASIDGKTYDVRTWHNGVQADSLSPDRDRPALSEAEGPSGIRFRFRRKAKADCCGGFFVTRELSHRHNRIALHKR